MRIILICHNIRSCYNVGALLRTADGLGITMVYLTGYTPYPTRDLDARLPHLAQTIDRQIHKTALGAETTVAWRQSDRIEPILAAVATDGYVLTALEQSAKARQLPDFYSAKDTALIVGREVEGLEPDILARCTQILEVPMHGKKESFNVAAATAMALYHLKFIAPQV